MGARALERGVIVGTAGHIDHGKTALVRALTGIDTDRLPEEKRRGITIELGFAPLTLDGVGMAGVVDVPGHEDFVRSMLVGASGVDVGLLIVAADEGIMPQTREHLLILTLLEIPSVVVALTKCDLVEADWVGLVRADIESALAASPWPQAPIITCSATTGHGLAELRRELAAAGRALPRRPGDDSFRLPVDRVFSVRGTGTVVTGTLWSGSVERDAALRVLPGGRHARVRRIEQHGNEVAAAVPGTRTALALAGVDVGDVPRGSTIVTDPGWRATDRFEAIVSIDAGASAELKPRTRVRFHAGAAEVGARVTPLGASALRPGVAAFARLSTDAPVVLRGGDRFVLRLPAPVGTIGGGTVVDPYSRRRAPRLPVDAELRALSESGENRLDWILENEGARGVAVPDVPVRSGLSPSAVETALNAARRARGANNLFSRAVVEETMARVRMIIAEYEITSPLSTGIPMQLLRTRLGADEELVAIAIAELERGGEIETEGPHIRRTGWAPNPSAIDLEACHRLAHDICAAEREPPSVAELVSRHGSAVPGLLQFLEREGRLVRVEADRYYDRATLAEMVSTVREALADGEVRAPGQLRDVLGCSRKYLIPFLEYCDRTGVTERRGEGRALRRNGPAVLDGPWART